MWLALYFYWIIRGLTLQLCIEGLLFAVAGGGEPDSRPLRRLILVRKSRIMQGAHITSCLLSPVPAIVPPPHQVYPASSNQPSPGTRREVLLA